jgi:dihydroorotate dehydrogenase electron transfer subunit
MTIRSPRLTAPVCVPARITERKLLAPDIVSVWLRAGRIAETIKPGQFVQVQIPDSRRDTSGAMRKACPELFLRRPLSIAQQRGNRIRLVFRVIGQGTARLAASRPGDEWNLLGPLGKPAPALRDRDVILIGGGIGIPPLLFLAERIARANRVFALLGARNRQDLILRPEFRGLPAKLALATDDGSLGKKGLVTDILRSALGSRHSPVVFACGPRPMLRRVKELTPGIESYAFWEERMGCGTGICYGCAVKRAGSDRYIRFCREGPVLRLSEIEV